MCPAKQEVLEGEPLALVCKATGMPSPNITWFKGKQALQPGTNIKIVSSKGEGVTESHLFILKCTPEDQHEEYGIQAKNQLDEDRHNFAITGEYIYK